MVLREYPNFTRYLQKKVYKYSDPNLKQLKRYIWGVPFFRGYSASILYKIMFSLEYKFFEEGSLLESEGSKVDSMLIIMNGSCTFQTYFEGNLFKLERLYNGSIINYRTFLLGDDEMQLEIKSYENGSLLKCSLQSILSLRD
jgi:signal-transduction protein with cAMP-binding, CBS, and nucleotidyltransferase domain